MAAQSGSKKCAHPSCDCRVEGNKRYCSEYCEKAGTMTELHCNCKHAACS